MHRKKAVQKQNKKLLFIKNSFNYFNFNIKYFKTSLSFCLKKQRSITQKVKQVFSEVLSFDIDGEKIELHMCIGKFLQMLKYLRSKLIFSFYKNWLVVYSLCFHIRHSFSFVNNLMILNVSLSKAKIEFYKL